MKKLKGKCKTCLGCNLLLEKGFKGRNKCKYYAKDYYNFDNFLIIAFVIFSLSIITSIISIAIWLYKFNMLCGG